MGSKVLLVLHFTLIIFMCDEGTARRLRKRVQEFSEDLAEAYQEIQPKHHYQSVGRPQHNSQEDEIQNSPVVADFNPVRRHYKKKMDQFAETGEMGRRMFSNGPVIKVFVVPENLAPDVIQSINEEASRGTNRGGGSNKGSPMFAVGGKVSIG